MRYDDHELGADGGVWIGGGGTSSSVPSITPLSLAVSRAKQPDPAIVPILEPYDINSLGEHLPLPADFVPSACITSQKEVPANFNPYQIWDYNLGL